MVVMCDVQHSSVGREAGREGREEGSELQD